ncbi:MAG: DNA alkylation repair protein [Candidatus Eisenbacteria bacterium]|nr:DNA alkylation repair protein [Candidatus Eisenbacteria bacterium]
MTPAAAPAPRTIAAEALARIRSLADPKRAESNQRFFKEPVPMYGLDAKTIRTITRETASRVKGAWTVRETVRFVDAMVRDPRWEARAVAYLMLERHAKDAGPELLPAVRRWLEKSCGNWAAVDTLAPSVLAPLLDRHPELIGEVTAWTDSPNLWLRRGAAVAFVPLARKGRRLNEAYRVAGRLLGDDEDLMHKAVGWLLREAGRTDRPRLEAWLRKKGPRIPRTSLRYAIEHFPETRRKALLRDTRPR